MLRSTGCRFLHRAGTEEVFTVACVGLLGPGRELLGTEMGTWIGTGWNGGAVIFCVDLPQRRGMWGCWVFSGNEDANCVYQVWDLVLGGPLAGWVIWRNFYIMMYWCFLYIFLCLKRKC